jgi:hypothetical protein
LVVSINQPLFVQPVKSPVSKPPLKTMLPKALQAVPTMINTQNFEHTRFVLAEGDFNRPRWASTPSARKLLSTATTIWKILK